MTTFGTLTHTAGGVTLGWGRVETRPLWAIETRPHVAMRLKRVFPQIAGNARGVLYLVDTIETARDIEWVLDRFPLEMDEPTAARLRSRADAWRARTEAIDAILSGRAEPLPLGDPARAPRPYQLVAAQMAAASGRLLLADDVGLGKTMSSLLLLADPEALPALVVTLTHLPEQWLDELAATWPTLRGYAVTKGTAYDLRGRSAARPLPDVVVMGYSKLAGWADALAGQVRTVIFDEVQELRHGTDTKKGAAAARVSADAAFVLGLSATPVYNYGGEIHNIFSVLSPDALGSREEFLREWGASDYASKIKVADPAALGTYLRDSGLMLRRTRKDVHRQMPDTVQVVQHVEADPDVLDRLSGDVAAMAALVLDQAADNKARFTAAGDLDWRLRQATGIAKAPYVAEFVRLLLDSEEKVVLFGWHRAVYDIWAQRLAPYRPVLYTGSESPRQKAAAKERFVDGDARVLMMSLRAGAGLDGLQSACSIAVFGELDWSPEIHRQCIGRIDRDGQEAAVAAYFLVASDGADPVMAEVLQLKRQQAEPIRDPDAALFTETPSNADRVQLLARAVLDRPRRKEATA